jgi:hypothetical protein
MCFTGKYQRESSSVGRARPCQGRGREFESRLSLHKKAFLLEGFFIMPDLLAKD